MKALFISRDYNKHLDGGGVVTKRNLECLIAIGYEVTEFHIPTPSLFTRIKNLLFRESYGSTSKLYRTLELYLTQPFDLIFFDGSIYGGYVKVFSEKKYRTICFYHNVEYVYYKEKYRITKKWQDYLMISFIRYNESLSTNYSEIILTINDRDNQVLKNVYGRGANYVFSTSFPNVEFSNYLPHIMDRDYLLFVGSNFFANKEAVDFIISIATQISKNVIIIGNINEAYTNKDYPSNIFFYGRVNNIIPYYLGAAAVLTPIFSGSGLKTKTVEALQFAKTIIGTKESFEGIPISQYPNIGFICNTPNEFIDVIESKVFDKSNKQSLDLFNSTFSNEMQYNKLKNYFRSQKLL